MIMITVEDETNNPRPYLKIDILEQKPTTK